MPNFNGMGPAGTGARTGRGMGKCVGGDIGRCGQRRGAGRKFQSGECPNELSLEEQEKKLQEQLALVKAARQQREKSE